MRYLLDYTPSEIADALDLPTGTVNSRLRRALDQLGAAYRGGERCLISATELSGLEIPEALESEARAWRLLDAAFDERIERPGRDARGTLAGSSRRSLSVVGAMVIALTPAGAEVREWISDTIGNVGEPNAKRALDTPACPGIAAWSAPGRRSRSFTRTDRSRRLGVFDDVELVAARALRGGGEGEEAAGDQRVRRIALGADRQAPDHRSRLVAERGVSSRISER